jgi:hypothetical protein
MSPGRSSGQTHKESGESGGQKGRARISPMGRERPLAPTYSDSRSIRVGRGGGQISPWIRNPSFNAACLTMSGPHSHRSLLIHLIASLPGMGKDASCTTKGKSLR